MIFGVLYFCVVILCVNRSRSSFILYRIVKRHSRQSNVRRIWTCADNDDMVVTYDHVCSLPVVILLASTSGNPSIAKFLQHSASSFNLKMKKFITEC